MDKRSLLFIVLTFLVIMIYSYINAPDMMQIEEDKEETEQIPEDIQPERREVRPPREFSRIMDILEGEKQELSHQSLYINTSLQRMILDIERAGIISCQLNDYYTNISRTKNIELISEESEEYLIFPIDLLFFDEDIQKINTKTPFIPSISPRDFHDKYPVIREEQEISFTKEINDMKITKIMRLYPDKYGLDLYIHIENYDDTEYAVIAGPNLLQDREELKTRGRYAQPDNIVYRINEKNEGIKADNIDNMLNVLPPATEFISLNDLYFTQALISKDRSAYPFYTDNLVIGYIFNDKNAEISLYLGPKNKRNLSAFEPSLESLVNFGFFSVIAIPLHNVINIFYSFIGNYGLAIIVLTIAIKLIFFPITFKSFLQMRRMSKLNPQMKELRKKFKDQPQKMNQEIQMLYKKHNVNPIAGCLPMFLQLPVLFSLYRVLSIAIELRHQGFLWIEDLAGPDPYLVLPILMSIAMFFQQRLTPTSADPKQAKMMSIMMPALFFIMFRNLQAGLVLYWFTSNLLIIIEQTIINKAHRKEEQRA